MCCNFIEGETPKCFEYIPSSDSIEFDDLNIEIIREKQKYNKIKKKSFKVTNRTSNEIKKIVHIQILDWEDNSVPQIREEFNSINYIIFMIQHKLRKHIGKVLVHCSAGIGRSGVILSLYELITTLENQFKTVEIPCISVFGTVRNLREQRWGMVATVAQYEFIYSFMEYWIAAYIFSNEN